MTRTARVSILLVAAIAIVVVLSLGTGSAGLSPLSTIDAAFGRGERVDVMIVQQWRLPRAVAAIV
ncbi:MAG: iron ABC transporter permease, partial [Microbacterium sp.]